MAFVVGSCAKSLARQSPALNKTTNSETIGRKWIKSNASVDTWKRVEIKLRGLVDRNALTQKRSKSKRAVSVGIVKLTKRRRAWSRVFTARHQKSRSRVVGRHHRAKRSVASSINASAVQRDFEISWAIPRKHAQRGIPGVEVQAPAIGRKS